MLWAARLTGWWARNAALMNPPRVLVAGALTSAPARVSKVREEEATGPKCAPEHAFAGGAAAQDPTC